MTEMDNRMVNKLTQALQQPQRPSSHQQQQQQTAGSNRRKKTKSHQAGSTNDASNVMEQGLSSNSSSESEHEQEARKPMQEGTTNVAEIVKTTVTALLPTIINEVKRAVEEANTVNMGHLQEEIELIHENMKREKILTKRNEDRLEQYSRRENVRIDGIVEWEGENEDTLTGLCSENYCCRDRDTAR